MAEDPFGVRQGERETLNGVLDWYRQVVTNKVDGLSTEAASRVLTPTGLSPLGVVAHLTWVEAGWFRDTFAGEPMPPEAPSEESFRLAPEDTVDAVVARYRDECARSRAIVAAAASLDEQSARSASVYGRVSLRWILVHMVEETARHAGHLDLMRETLDGRTGD